MRSAAIPAHKIAQKPMMLMAYTKKFIAIVCATFLDRVRPVSSKAKPACMNITMKPQSNVQTRLVEMLSWPRLCATRPPPAAPRI